MATGRTRQPLSDRKKPRETVSTGNVFSRDQLKVGTNQTSISILKSPQSSIATAITHPKGEQSIPQMGQSHSVEDDTDEETLKTVKMQMQVAVMSEIVKHMQTKLFQLQMATVEETEGPTAFTFRRATQGGAPNSQ